MSDGPDSLVLRYPRAMDAKIDRMAEDVREIKGCVGTLDERYATVSRRLDSLELRHDQQICREGKLSNGGMIGDERCREAGGSGSVH